MLEDETERDRSREYLQLIDVLLCGHPRTSEEFRKQIVSGLQDVALNGIPQPEDEETEAPKKVSNADIMDFFGEL